MHEHRFRRYWILAAKVAVGAGLLTYLVVQAQQHESFQRVLHQPKRWSILILSVGLLAFLAALTVFRWYLLVRALGLRFRLKDAMRLGSLGYVLNLVSLGTVGGDLFKAVLIAKDQPGKRTEAVATVVLDRIVGLYALLLVAAGAVLVSDSYSGGGAIAALSNVTLLTALVATVGVAVLMLSVTTSQQAENRLRRVPLIGQTAARLLVTVRIFRGRPLVVLVAATMSVGVHVLLTLVVLSVAHGLPGTVPSITDHFLIVPLSNVAGSVPVTPNGLGTFELAMDTLYQLLGDERGVVRGTGTIVALGYRLTNITVAARAAAYYVISSGGFSGVHVAQTAAGQPPQPAALDRSGDA